MLPNLIVIGAAKAGTTSLHSYLARHPQVGMSAVKELKFFTRDDWRDRLDWYADRFPDAQVRGESSPNYTMYPYLPSVAERVRDVVPECRFIYVLRDPIERAVADYVEHVYLGFEKRGIDAALSDLDDPANPHVCPSRYASQLARYLDCFPREQVLVLDQDDLRSRRAGTLKTVFDFIDVDASFTTGAFDETHNSSEEKVAYNRLGRWLIQKNLFTEKREFLYRGPLVQPLRSLLSRPISRSLSPDTHARLVDALRPEVEDLRRLTGQPWDRWPSFPPATR